MNRANSRRWLLGTALAVGGATLGATGCGSGDGAREDARDRAAGGGTMTGAGHDTGMQPASSATTGLTSWANGHRLVAEQTRFEAGRRASFAFRVVDGSGRPLRRFGLDQTKRMHLILVRRDLTGYRHLHPSMAPSGRWSVPLTLRTPGAYRAYADFVIDGRRSVLGIDLQAPGTSHAASLRTLKRTAKTGGYVVRLAQGGNIRARADERLTFTVSRHGRPVRDLQPYLGALGHLVVLRERDLSYQHAHPEHGRRHHAGAGPTIEFAARLPSPSRYRAFLQFRAGGAVRTVAFTIAARRAES
jgi:hypothetical protein